MVWSGLAADIPVTCHVHLLELSFADPSNRFGLQVPLLTLGFDLRRPSDGGSSLSLSFVQAPLMATLLGPAVSASRSPVARSLVGAALWLSGGTFRWTPGGPGNLAATRTLSLVFKNEFAIHPFVEQRYWRDTVGAGVWLRVDAPWVAMTHNEDPIPRYLFGLGAFASMASEFHGARAFTPGVWASVSTLFPWD